MTLRASRLAGLGLAAYSAFLVATIPAAYVASQVEAAAPGQLEISDAQGTLWRGNARVTLAPTRGGKAIERVTWRFNPARLFAGELAFDAEAKADGLAARGQVARGPSSWAIRGARIEGDAGAVANFIPLLATWRPTGMVTLQAPELSIGGREIRGSAEAEWRGAAIALSEVRPLGSYRASWRGDNGPGSILVTTLQGPLRVSGGGTTTAPFRIAFSGEARAEGEQQKALEPLLDRMGPRRPDGARALELRLD